MKYYLYIVYKKSTILLCSLILINFIKQYLMILKNIKDYANSLLVIDNSHQF